MLYEGELCPGCGEISFASSVMGLFGSSQRLPGRWPMLPGGLVCVRARWGAGCARTLLCGSGGRRRDEEGVRPLPGRLRVAQGHSPAARWELLLVLADLVDHLLTELPGIRMPALSPM